LHNLSKQANKAQCLREGQGQNTRKKPRFNPKVSVWHKTITVASRTGRIFFLKTACEAYRTRSKNISSSGENGASVYFFIFLISNFLAKFNNKLENLVEFTLKKKILIPVFSQFILQTKNSEILPEQKTLDMALSHKILHILWQC